MMKEDKGVFDVSMNTTSETGIVSSRFRIKILKSFTKVESFILVYTSNEDRVTPKVFI